MTATIHSETIPLSDRVKEFLARPKQLLIGTWRDAALGETFETENPSTSEVITEVASAGPEDVDAAVSAAADVRMSWQDTPPAARASLIHRVGELINENLEELAQLESLDTGKPISMSRSLDVPFTAENFKYAAGWATKLRGETFDITLADRPAFHAFTVREPVGVAAGIIPWNYPLAQASFKIAPALAAGCPIILKPAEQTPLSALRLGELILEAGVPEGVVSILTGFGESAGAAIAEHAGIDKVSFTGSTAVGKKIMSASAATNLKRVTLELGGKSPTIIFSDADLERAIPTAANAIFGNTGQVCNAGSRLYVERSVYDRVMEGVAAYAEALRVGHGLDPLSEIGALMSSTQFDRVSGYVDEGLSHGAEMILGGPVDHPSGYFYRPTILTNTGPEMSIVTDEIFGPVLVAEAFDDETEVQAVSNETVYGLAATIFTQDISKAHRLARRLNAGAVWINCFGVFDPNLPFGGFKQSGMGREMAREGIEAFTELKAITVQL